MYHCCRRGFVTWKPKFFNSEDTRRQSEEDIYSQTFIYFPALLDVCVQVPVCCMFCMAYLTNGDRMAVRKIIEWEIVYVSSWQLIIGQTDISEWTENCIFYISLKARSSEYERIPSNSRKKKKKRPLLRKQLIWFIVLFWWTNWRGFFNSACFYRALISLIRWFLCKEVYMSVPCNQDVKTGKVLQSIKN